MSISTVLKFAVVSAALVVLAGCGSPVEVTAPAALDSSYTSPAAGGSAGSAPRFNDPSIVNPNTGVSVYTDDKSVYQ